MDRKGKKCHAAWMTNTPAIDLLTLERHTTLGAGFRADELYFVRLAGVYLQSIFWDVFPAKATRREQMFALAKQRINRDTHPELYDSILDARTRSQHVMDCLSGVFREFLKCFLEEENKELRATFQECLRHHHAIFLSLDEFLAQVLAPLIKKRNALEHFEDKNTQKKIRKGNRNWDDDAFIHALTVLLPPEFWHLYTGRILSIRNALTDSGKIKYIDETLATIECIFIQSRTRRREGTKRLFAEERTRSNITQKHKRKALVSLSQDWKMAHTSLNYQRKDDYREWEFRMRYYFMGKQNFHNLCRLLRRGNETTPLGFKRDVEAMYFLATKVNLRIHRYLARLPMVEDDKGKKRLQGIDAEETELLQAIRNGVAHNRLFFLLHKRDGSHFSVQEMFSVLLVALQRQGLHNDFKAGLEGMFRKEVFAVVDRRMDAMRQPQKIRRWTEENRQNYNRESYERDMRHATRREVGRWMLALQKAWRQHCVAIENKAKKC